MEQRLTSPEQEGVLAAGGLGTGLQLLPGSPACWPVAHHTPHSEGIGSASPENPD